MVETDSTGPTPIVVTVAADSRPDITALAEQMREVGMTVEAILTSIGVVTGTATPAQADAVANLPGVAAVEGDQTVRPRPSPHDAP